MEVGRSRDVSGELMAGACNGKVSQEEDHEKQAKVSTLSCIKRNAGTVERRGVAPARSLRAVFSASTDASDWCLEKIGDLLDYAHL